MLACGQAILQLKTAGEIVSKSREIWTKKGLLLNRLLTKRDLCNTGCVGEAETRGKLKTAHTGTQKSEQSPLSCLYGQCET